MPLVTPEVLSVDDITTSRKRYGRVQQPMESGVIQCDSRVTPPGAEPRPPPEGLPLDATAHLRLDISGPRHSGVGCQLGVPRHDHVASAKIRALVSPLSGDTVFCENNALDHATTEYTSPGYS
uniref:Uncharacterized protein n=1 Tax=Timema shepardi TaxID=629360 RepID=A0A7R9B613_TIMSH|nr:unnamed protein product [Timema shepardi]